MILSGGGARGAYEVGVLWYIFDDLSRMRGAPPRIDILCGTSVGAINACYLAAHLTDPHRFYRTDGSAEQLRTNLKRMLDSVRGFLDLPRIRSYAMSEYLLKSR